MRRIPFLVVFLAALTLRTTAWASSSSHSGSLAHHSTRPVMATKSDFNGDGYADLAIGAPGDTVSGFLGAGAVNVLYGTSSGLQADNPDDQRWTQASGGIPGDPETDDNFGAAVATGDFNGDGFADLAVGVPLEDILKFDGSTATDAGRVNVIYGSASGLTSTGAQLWSQEGEVLGVPDSFDHFGNALATGDFNGDGFADLAVGVPGDTVTGIAGAGSVNVFYGSASGLQIQNPADQLWNQSSADVQGDPEANANFGFAVAVGDFNKDGFADLATGIPGQTVSDRATAGDVSVLYGSAAGLQAVSPDDQLWSQDSPGIVNAAEVGDQFGYSLAVGDFNGNGFDDIAIGVPFEDPPTDSGAVNVIYGASGGLSSAGNQIWSQNSPGILNTSETGDEFGYSLAAGDFNGNGFDDIAIGVPYEDPPTDSGASNVIYGSSAGLTSTGNQIWSQNSAGVQDDGEEGDHFAASLASGDFDKNGSDDVAFGVPGEDVNSRTDTGAVNVLYGVSSGGLQASNPDDDFWNEDSNGVKGDTNPGNVFGTSVGAS